MFISRTTAVLGAGPYRSVYLAAGELMSLFDVFNLKNNLYFSVTEFLADYSIDRKLTYSMPGKCGHSGSHRKDPTSGTPCDNNSTDNLGT